MTDTTPDLSYTEERLIDDDRDPTGWCTYPRPVYPDPRRPLGRSMLGERWWPVVAQRHADGRTRVGFSLIQPDGEPAYQADVRRVIEAYEAGFVRKD